MLVVLFACYDDDLSLLRRLLPSFFSHYLLQIRGSLLQQVGDLEKRTDRLEDWEKQLGGEGDEMFDDQCVQRILQIWLQETPMNEAHT